ncbi:actin nucleation-promoting factor WAS [Ictalurus furcatus]|uniref:actin nucleation-promoting factor WAS n=1 Tax=Ictalurus furcatus TaxID=66913 RepID=UPI002350B093|nr:actin nucleation-promoting factor WAS [Ictalurus furcatus]
MKRRSKEKSQENLGSRLLTPQENERVVDLLGRRCVSLCTTVVQLFMALPHNPGSWSLQHTGVLCFIKDNPQRSYFIRLYDIKANKLLWEQELFNQFTYNNVKPFFHTFQADECQVGLNFANSEEAENFFLIVDEKNSQRNKNLDKRQGKGLTLGQEHDVLPPLPPNGYGSQNVLPLGNINIQNQAPPTKSKKEKKEKEKKNKKKGSKLSKALIGAPSGFTHVGHLGMQNNSVDPDLMTLLSRAGISEADLNDSETSQLIYDVIERSGGVEAVKQKMNQQGHPPPPPPSARRTSLPPVPPGSSSAPLPSQARFGPLPPPPGGTSSPATRSSSVRALPPTPSGGRTGPLPPPPVAQGGRRGPLPQPPGSQVAPSSRSAPLPPVPGGHDGPRPPPPGDRGGSPSSATFSRSGPLPPLPGRGSGPAPPGERSGPQRLASRDQSASMPPGHSSGSFPPPPGRRTGSLPQPPNDECYLLPPPTLSEDFPPSPSSDFLPLGSEDFPPLPLPDEFYPPPPTNAWDTSDMVPDPPLANSSRGGPPPPPPPPPPAAPAPKLERGPPPPKASSEGGGRGALLDQIRVGTKLKTVTASPDPPPSATLDTGEGIVGALMMVMQKRSKVIHSSDEGDEFDDEDDDDDEWD